MLQENTKHDRYMLILQKGTPESLKLKSLLNHLSGAATFFLHVKIKFLKYSDKTKNINTSKWLWREARLTMPSSILLAEKIDRGFK